MLRSGNHPEKGCEALVVSHHREDNDSQVLPHFIHHHESSTVTEGSCGLLSTQSGQNSKVVSHWKLDSVLQSCNIRSQVVAHCCWDTDSDGSLFLDINRALQSQSNTDNCHEAIVVTEDSCSLPASQLGQMNKVVSHQRLDSVSDRITVHDRATFPKSQKLGSEFQSCDLNSKVASCHWLDDDSDYSK